MRRQERKGRRYHSAQEFIVEKANPIEQPLSFIPSSPLRHHLSSARSANPNDETERAASRSGTRMYQGVSPRRTCRSSEVLDVFDDWATLGDCGNRRGYAI